MSGTISAAKLREYTGLTDRRHRQLADKGLFPLPVKGQYKDPETLRAIIKNYQEAGQRNKDKKGAIDDEKHRKLKLENDLLDGQLTNTAELIRLASEAGAKARELIYHKIEDEAPRAMSKLDVPSARIVGGNIAAELVAQLQRMFKAWPI